MAYGRRMRLAVAALVLAAVTAARADPASQCRSAEQRDGRSESRLDRELAAIAAKARGRVGVKAVVLETGETAALEPSGRFPMQSVYKLPIAMTVLHRVDTGALALTDKIPVTRRDYVSPGQRSPLRDAHPEGTDVTLDELLRLAVSESDGSASDVLLRVLGGPAVVQKYLGDLDITGIAVRDTEQAIGRDWAVQYRNWASPEAAIALLRALVERHVLSAPSTERLRGWMTETPTGEHRLKGLLPAGTRVTHKTGTSGTRSGVTAATNDIGIIALPGGRHLAIAVFVADARADETTREHVIAEIARAAWDHWSDHGRSACPLLAP